VDLAGGDLLQPRHHPQGGGLAAAGGADQDHELLVADVQVHVLDGVHLVVLLVERFQHHLGHRTLSLTWVPRGREPRALVGGGAIAPPARGPATLRELGVDRLDLILTPT